MAISLEMTVDRFKLVCKTAYVKVGSIRGDVDNMWADLLVYASPEARAANVQPVEMLRVEIPTPKDEVALWPALYAAIKQRPEFAGAEDC